jgi:hypothetical protein
MMAGTKWGKQEVRLLYQLSKAGKTVKDVMLVFPGRSRNSIEKKASCEGWSLAGPSQEIDMAAFKRLMGK